MLMEADRRTKRPRVGVAAAALKRKTAAAADPLKPETAAATDAEKQGSQTITNGGTQVSEATSAGVKGKAGAATAPPEPTAVVRTPAANTGPHADSVGKLGVKGGAPNGSKAASRAGLAQTQASNGPPPATQTAARRKRRAAEISDVTEAKAPAKRRAAAAGSKAHQSSGEASRNNIHGGVQASSKQRKQTGDSVLTSSAEPRAAVALKDKPVLTKRSSGMEVSSAEEPFWIPVSLQHMSSAEAEIVIASAPAQSGVLLRQPVHAAPLSTPVEIPELLLLACYMAREAAAELSQDIFLQRGD